MAIRCRWPPENSCGNGRRAPGRGRPGRAARATRSARRPSCRPWIASGSASDLRRTVSRGFSEANGSWKTNWIRRRRRAARRGRRPGCRRRRAGPSRRRCRAAAPRSGPGCSCRSRSRRPARTSRPASTCRLTPATALHRAVAPAEQAAADGVVLDQVLDLAGAARHDGPAFAARRARMAGGARGRAPTVDRRVGGPQRRTRPGYDAHGQRGAKRQPGGSASGAGGWPTIWKSRSPLARRSIRAARRAGPTCTGARLVEQRVDGPVLDQSPAYMTTTRSAIPRRRRGRG